MKYQLPEGTGYEGKNREDIPPVVIQPEEGELLDDLAFCIMRASVETAPLPKGDNGVWTPIFEHMNRIQRVTDEDIRTLRELAQQREIKIDKWKMERPVKLSLKIKDNYILLDFNWWLDRWNSHDWRGKAAPFTVGALDKMLQKAISYKCHWGLVRMIT